MQTPRSPHAQENKETKKCAKKQNKKHSPWNLDLLNKKLFKKFDCSRQPSKFNILFYCPVHFSSAVQL